MHRRSRQILSHYQMVEQLTDRQPALMQAIAEKALELTSRELYYFCAGLGRPPA
jgi:hypothetical protein